MVEAFGFADFVLREAELFVLVTTKKNAINSSDSKDVKKDAAKDDKKNAKWETVDEKVRNEPLPSLERVIHIDYGELFSYLSNMVKIQSYGYADTAAPEVTPMEEPEEDDFFRQSLTYKDILEIIRSAKIQNTLGVEVYLNPIRKSLFDLWKLGNGAENKFLYDSISI